MSVPYDYYRIFYYVAQYRSFTRAAKALLNSQPNITRSMNNLERELGCRLFVRTNRGISLTPDGEKLFGHVRLAQEQLEAGELELAGSRSLKSGTLSLAVSETALHELLLPVLRQFCRAYPGIRLRISNNSTPQAVAAVRSGQAELALVSTPTGVEPPLTEWKLAPFREILVAGPRFAALGQKTLHFRDLAGYPFVCMGRDTMTFVFYKELFARYGLTLTPDIEAATVDQVLPMVENDLGLGFLPRGYVRTALAQNRVVQVRLAESIPQRSICLVRDKTTPQSAAARELDKLLRAAAGEQAR